jgi:branched-chain amino acid transport system substrate-binding protein
MRVRQALAMVAVLSLALGCADMASQATPYNPGQHDPNAVQLGLVFHFTGSGGQQPQFLLNAVRMGVAEINAAGGVNGRPLEVVARDDNGDPAFGAQAARELVAGGAVALMTATSGVTSQILTTVTDSALVPVLSPSATSPSLTGLAAHGTFFRTAPSDAFQGAILASEVYAQGVRDVAIIRIGNAYGVGLSNVFTAQFTALGGSIRATVEYPNGKSLGFTQEVANLFAHGVPAGVLIVGTLVDGSNVTRDLDLYNPLPRPRYFGTEGLYDSSFLVNGASGVLSGFMGTSNASPTQSATYQGFAARFQDGTGQAPILFSDDAYDAVYLAALAMQQGGANTRAAMLANLRSVSNFSATPGADVVVHPGEWPQALAAIKAGRHVKYEGASGTIGWDGNGDVTSGTYLIYRITGTGQSLGFQTVKTVTFP